MENELEPNDESLPAVTDAPLDDALDKANQQVSGLDDDQMVKKMGSRTTVFGRVVTILLVLGGVGLDVAWYIRDQAYQHRWDVYRTAQDAGSQQEFLRAIREEL